MTKTTELLALCQEYVGTIRNTGSTVSPMLCGQAAQWNKAEDATMALSVAEANAMLDELAEKYHTDPIPQTELMLYSLLEDKLHQEGPQA